MTDTLHSEEMPRRPAPLPLVHLVLLSAITTVFMGAGAAGGFFLAASQDPIGSREEAEILAPSIEITPFDRIGRLLNRIEARLDEIQRTLDRLGFGPALLVSAVGAQPVGEGSVEQ